LPQGYTNFFFGCVFVMGLDKTKLHTKFEVTSFSRCRNNKGEPLILRCSPSPDPGPRFHLSVIFPTGLAKAMLHTKFGATILIPYGNISNFPPKICDQPKWETPYFWTNGPHHWICSCHIFYSLYNFCGSGRIFGKGRIHVIVSIFWRILLLRVLTPRRQGSSWPVAPHPNLFVICCSTTVPKLVLLSKNAQSA